MTLLDALLRWLVQSPPLQAMAARARYLLEATLMALVDPGTMTPRDLPGDDLRALHRGVGMAATLIDIVIGVRASEMAGLPIQRRGSARTETPRKRCDPASMIRRVLDLLHRLTTPKRRRRGLSGGSAPRVRRKDAPPACPR